MKRSKKNGKKDRDWREKSKLRLLKEKRKQPRRASASPQTRTPALAVKELHQVLEKKNQESISKAARRVERGPKNLSSKTTKKPQSTRNYQELIPSHLLSHGKEKHEPSLLRKRQGNKIRAQKPCSTVYLDKLKLFSVGREQKKTCNA